MMVDVVLQRFSTICHDSVRPMIKASGFLRCSLTSPRASGDGQRSRGSDSGCHVAPGADHSRLDLQRSFRTERTTFCCSQMIVNEMILVFLFRPPQRCSSTSTGATHRLQHMERVPTVATTELRRISRDNSHYTELDRREFPSANQNIHNDHVGGRCIYFCADCKICSRPRCSCWQN